MGQPTQLDDAVKRQIEPSEPLLLSFLKKQNSSRTMAMEKTPAGGVITTGSSGTGQNERIESSGVSSGQRWRTKLGRWAQPSMAAGAPCSRQRGETERS